jgi:oligoribonuclease NrnB/cAMP/cGMP phosphodiesterase (DHH superfamily)
MNKPLVIYHKNCNDGFGAAYAAWCKFGDAAEYFPMHYGDALTPSIDGREVYILDFSLPVDQMLEVILQAFRVVWLDHHQSAFENWRGKDYLTPERQKSIQTKYLHVDGEVDVFFKLDNQKAGCVLAWEYFHPLDDMPSGLMHIGDRDLWKFESINTKPFCEALSTYDKDFELWNSLMSPEMYFELIDKGNTLLQAQEQRVRSFSNPKKLKEVRFQMLDGTELNGLSCNVVSDISETGNSIAKQSGTFSLTYFVTATDVVCSLRSIGDYDVTPIARLYGGGGHKNAAGFKLPIHRFFKEIWNA